MTEPRRTKGMQNLLTQFDRAFPRRSKASDGWISDARHRQESSTDHSPDDTPGSNPAWDGDPDRIPEVRGLDVTADLNEPGVTMQDVIDHMLHSLPGLHTVIRYIIHNRKIWTWDGNSWVSKTYTGSSPHTEHAHFSGQRTQAADDNTTFDFRFEELTDMAKLDADDKKWITGEIGRLLRDALTGGTGDVVPRWTADGGPVDKNDSNPTMSIGYATYYIGTQIAQLRKAQAAQGGLLATLASQGGQQVNLSDAALADLTRSILAGLPADIADRIVDEYAERLKNDPVSGTADKQ